MMAHMRVSWVMDDLELMRASIVSSSTDTENVSALTSGRTSGTGGVDIGQVSLG